MQDLPPFPGFRPEALQFFRDLKENNDREWFKPRKKIFDDEVIWPLQCLMSEAAGRLQSENMELSFDPKKSVFRIYRDTRFSKNKAPYKTALGSTLSKDGSHRSSGIIYFHIDPGQCFFAAGFYMPDSPLLMKFRSRIQSEPHHFVALKEELEGKGLEVKGIDLLKRMPRGFEAEKDHPAAEYLKWKSFIAQQSVSDSALQDRSLVDTLVTFARNAYPLLDFGWKL